MRRMGAWEQARAGGSVNQRTDWYMIEESQRSRKGVAKEHEFLTTQEG